MAGETLVTPEALDAYLAENPPQEPGVSDRLWNALGSVLYPRWLYRGPYWWRSVNAWWLQWWGAAFFYTDPWRPFRAPRD